MSENTKIFWVSIGLGILVTLVVVGVWWIFGLLGLMATLGVNVPVSSALFAVGWFTALGYRIGAKDGRRGNPFF